MKNETDDLMDGEGWAFWRAFGMVVVLSVALIALFFLLIIGAVYLPVAISGALKMLGGVA